MMLQYFLIASCIWPRVFSSLPDVSSTLQNILKNTDNSDKYTYPTDLTRGIIPKAFHSHNDYWRDVPFYTALSYGAMSIEADVWLINDTLYVGHELSALTPQRTLDSLYLSPILDTLSRQNPNTPFVTTPTKNGVYDTSATQTLYLFIDLKTPGPSTWPAVLSALAPLQNLGYLSTYDGSTFTSNPITVVGTGNTPLDAVQSAVPRFAFFDAPLPLLSTTFGNITAEDSPIASTDFEANFGVVKGVGVGMGVGEREGAGGEVLNDTQVELLREQVGAAHAKGIKVRYWNLPAWPVGTRNSVWRALWEEGVDFLNADDVEGVSGFWEGRG